MPEPVAAAGAMALVPDARAAAWRRILIALFLAGYFAVAAVELERGDVRPGWQALLAVTLLWGQLAAGMRRREGSGHGWSPMTGRARVAEVVVLAVVVVCWVLTVVNGEVRLAVRGGVVVCLGYAVYGVVQLGRALRGPRPLPRGRVPLSGAVRAGTVGVGVVLGGAAVVAGSSEASPVAVFALFLVVFAWMLASGTRFGLPAIGAAWRAPHVVSCVIGAVGVGTAAVLPTRGPSGSGGVVVGVAVVVLFLIVSVIPGGESDA